MTKQLKEIEIWSRSEIETEMAIVTETEPSDAFLMVVLETLTVIEKLTLSLLVVDLVIASSSFLVLESVKLFV